MGDPKFIRKKYSAPPHPWQRKRIEEENLIVKEYGLKNKREVWKMRTIAKKFAQQAMNLNALDTKQARKEEALMLAKIYRFSLLPKGATLDDALSISLKDVLERRLQTLVFKKGLARTISQARQFITHRHVTIGDKVITAPSYIVSADEEGRISFIAKSSLADPDHPERVVARQAPAPKEKEAEGKQHGKRQAKFQGRREKPRKERKEEHKAENKGGAGE